MLELQWESELVKQSFTHENESAEPGFYRVKLNNDILVELTCSKRSGVHRYTFPKGTVPLILLDLLHRDPVLDAEITIVDDKNVQGMRHSSAWAVNQKLFFHIQFSHAFTETIANPTHINMRKAFLFENVEGPVTLWVGLSSTSAEAAKRNLMAESATKTFDNVREEIQTEWEKELGKIEITATDNQKSIFYSALYHSMIVPNIFSDVDGRYRGMDGEVHAADGDHYTVFSLWDTYRAAHPLYTLIDHQRTADFLRTFDRMFSQTGRLPIWELAGNETECMIGYHGASVIADAQMKGLSPLSDERALEMMTKSSEYPLFGMKEYREKMYLDIEDEPESVSKTLEYGYDDFCVAQVARKANRLDVARRYDRYSLAYRNLLDENGFMQPRSNGRRMIDFDPLEVNSHYTEANSWQYSFYAPHDLEGYKKALGGEKALENQLDALFNAELETTGRTQADITGLIGQYAHGNEPSHHIAYLYSTTDSPYKTQEKVKQILEQMYHNAPDGLSGNEDCGQMSAWYVLSSLGFYPVCPGDPTYVFGYPALEKAKVLLGNGNILIIKRKGTGNYISSVQFNQQDWPYLYINHRDLMKGGELVFQMSSRPSTWGSPDSSRYSTAVNEDYLPSPILNYSSPVFFDSLQISWQNPLDAEVRIVHLSAAKDNTKEVKSVAIKENSTLIKESGRWQIYFQKGKLVSPPTIFEVHKRENHYAAQWTNVPNTQYQAGGPDALIDEVYGDEEWRKGRWIGIQDDSFIAEIDLLQLKQIDALGLNCLQDVRSWIVFPRRVAFYGKRNASDTWKFIGENLIGDRSNEEGSSIVEFKIPVKESFRYIKVHAEPFGPLPDWHPGAGNPSFIFIDELNIR